MPTASPPAPAKTDTASAPAPAPAPAPSPAPKPAAHVDASPEADPDFAAIQKQFDAHDSKDEPAPKPEKAPEKDKAAPAKQPAKDEKPVTAKDDKTPKEPKELRAQYEKVSGEAKTLREAVAALEAKIAEGELKGKDVTALTERLEAREKELEERDKVIRALKREQDPKFKEKWDAPFEAAAETARRSIERLPLTDADGNTRKAQFKDFIPFYRSAVAEGGVIDFDGLKEKFGDGFQVALSHLNSLIEKNDQRERALADENKRWETELKEAEAAEVRQREEMTNLRSKAYAYVEQQSEWFKQSPDDTERNELLTKGRELVSRQPKTPGEAALLQAEIFHRAAAHPLMAHQLEKMKSELDAARAEIEELKSSAPNTTRRDGSATKTSSGDDWEDLRREVKEAGHAD